MAKAKVDVSPALVLFRRDLRVGDNRALAAAAQSGKPVIPVLVFDENEGRAPGAASRWWLHGSIEALSEALDVRGVKLVLRRGPQAEIVSDLVETTGADSVFWNRRYDPPGSEADRALKRDLRQRGVDAESFDGQLLHEPTLLLTGSGTPYKVFSPFWRALVAGGEPRAPVAAPKIIKPFRDSPRGDSLADWRLKPTTPDWAGGLRESWTPGEAGAAALLRAFADDSLDGYAKGRDYPASGSTTRLSPHLAHGEITPFQIWHALNGAEAPGRDIEKLRQEIVWREFCAHLLFHHPDLATRNFNARFDAFPWKGGDQAFECWTKGQTGYPIVDAGMRELWRTGWMHNRVRMVCASFLSKHLLQDWRRGEAWFWDTLVDADPASNPANWQWVAGSGADAAPYFRVFNPMLQGERFDPDGDYVRANVPELARMPAKHIHAPWKAPGDVLDDAGVSLGTTYPMPTIEHGKGRDRALAAYERIKGAA